MDIQLDQAVEAFWSFFEDELQGTGFEPLQSGNKLVFPLSGRNSVPGMNHLTPAARFETNTYRLVSQVNYDSVHGTPEIRDRLLAGESELQTLYLGHDQLHVVPRGRTQIYVQVVRDGSPANRGQWPDYAQWFITTQHQLRAALTAFNARFAVDDSNTPHPQQRVTEARVSEGLVEALESEAYEVRAVAERVGTQPEKELVQRFEQYLTFHHHRARGRTIAMPEGGPLRIDIVDLDENIIYEAKADAGRMSVRLALGQLLDYEHNARAERPGTRMAVLLPTRPAQDLVELLTERKIGCVVENNDRMFTDITGLGLCPPTPSEHVEVV